MTTHARLRFGRYDYAAFATFVAYAACSLVVPIVLVTMARDLGFPLDRGGMTAGGGLHLETQDFLCLVQVPRADVPSHAEVALADERLNAHERLPQGLDDVVDALAREVVARDDLPNAGRALGGSHLSVPAIVQHGDQADTDINVLHAHSQVTG